MKFFSLFFVIFLILTFQSFAGSFNDTIPKEKYKMSEKSFLTIYGTDDTSKALIKYYFGKRNGAETRFALYGIIFTGEVLLARRAAVIDLSDNPSFGEVSIVVGVALYTAVVFLPANGLLIGGIHNFHKYSRKRLYVDLMNYENGKGLPKRYKKKVLRLLSNSK